MALFGKTALKCALVSMKENAKWMGHASAPEDGQDLIALNQVSQPPFKFINAAAITAMLEYIFI